MQAYLLTILILLPTLGAVALVGHGLVYKRESHYRWIALLFSVATFALSLLLLGGGGREAGGFRFVEDVTWISSINSRYHIGVDGISLWLVLLTTLLVPISILSSWTSVTKRQLSYYVFLLILESAMIGVFVSLDLLVFYLFFEASLVPMFFLIGIWGGKERVYAATKFFIYTAIGSLLMLAGIISLYFIFDSWDYVAIVEALRGGTRGYTNDAEFWLFLA
ncbi:MAG TPA: proton-conducting transporter membrane subunit, partial [Pyrinomonadaceae bacterium]|nr:proton-conducting transporter membrane subunit [Pyrinomonadaceae bacterium]